MKLTHGQKQALEDIRDHQDPWARVQGCGRLGGWNAVLNSLIKKGLINDGFSEGAWLLTADGISTLGGVNDGSCPWTPDGRPFSDGDRYQMFLRGWGDAAKVGIKRYEGYPDYDKGYAEGQASRSDAVKLATERTGYVPSVLRRDDGQ